MIEAMKERLVSMADDYDAQAEHLLQECADEVGIPHMQKFLDVIRLRGRASGLREFLLQIIDGEFDDADAA